MQRLYYFFIIFFTVNQLSVVAQSSHFSASDLWLSSSESSREQNSSESDTAKIALFNFNPVLNPDNTEEVYKNILDEYFSLFAVFKTNGAADENVFKLSTRKHAIEVTSTFVDKGESIQFDKSNPSHGVILSYASKMRKYSRKNSLSFKDFYKRIVQDPVNNQLVEVLYFPRILNQTERSKIETYLSIKYGISLIGDKNYITSQNDTIWSYKKNKEFIHNITGIGKDAVHALNQKQSKNVLDDGLVIGFETIEKTNLQNNTVLSDGSFLLWGDNNGAVQFSNNLENTIQKMERIWKVQTSEKEGASKQKLQFQLDVEKMGLNIDSMDDPSNMLWLAVQDQYEDSFDFDSAMVFKQTSFENGVITFSDIPWEVMNEKSKYFTFFAAPAFFAKAVMANDHCLNKETTETQLDFTGGQAPYSIEVASLNQVITYETEDSQYTLDLDDGDFAITITDDLGQLFSTTVRIEKDEKPTVLLAPTWELDVNGQVRVIPTIKGDEKSSLEYTWHEGEKVLATGLQHTFRSEGHYEFMVKNTKGCETRFPIEVTRNALSSIGDAALFPNPVAINESFQLNLQLEQPSKVIIRIFNANGQLINTDKLSTTQVVNYQSALQSSGTYFVSVQTAQVSKTFKLLVK